MSQSYPAVDSPEARFEWIIEKFNKPLHQYCQSRVWRVRDFLDPIEDADDLFVLVQMKLWKAYFALDAQGVFDYKSDMGTMALLKRITYRALRDLIEKRQRELAHLKYLHVLELDAPIREDLEDGETLADFVKSNSNTALEAEASSRINVALAEECQQARSPGKQLVAGYLVGQRSREDLADYDENYIKVMTSRLYKTVCKSLGAE